MKKGSAFLLLFFLLPFLSGCGDDAGSKARYSGKLVKQYGGEKTRPDRGSEKSLILLRSGTNERLNLTYYRNGAYVTGALKDIETLFRDRTTGAKGEIDPELIDYLVDIRSRLGLPPTVVFEILSGYRSRTTNDALRDSNGQVAKESFHTRGWAVDFRIKNVNGKAIAEIAKTMQRGGVSYYPSSNHIHVDLGNIRTWSTR